MNSNRPTKYKENYDVGARSASTEYFAGSLSIRGNSVSAVVPGSMDTESNNSQIPIWVTVSASLPIDKTITQGYVYGLKDVDDYCGWFVGLSFASAAMAQGQAVASRKIYAVITNGTSTGVSLGVCRTYYFTAQSKWIYGKANMTIVIVPAQQLLPYPQPGGSVLI